MNELKLGKHIFKNRLLTGTGKFSRPELITPMLEASKSEMITVAVRRVDTANPDLNILNFIPKNVVLLPNTSGARNADEAVRIARIAREISGSEFIKIEIIPDAQYLMPDNEETVRATEILAREGFVVLPYIQPDLITCKKLEQVGAAAVMPLGSPIGSNQGLKSRAFLEMIIELSKLPVIVDAGIGRPSHAAEAMEMGADAVLVNTAISTALDPAKAGRAFALAVEAGRLAYEAKLQEEQKYASASSPLTGFLRDK